MSIKIFVHGLGQSSDSWRKTIKYLKNCRNIVCPDLCDMHNTEQNYNSLYKSFADFCNGFEEPVDLCGLSLGSILAMNYSVDYPNKVNSLVLIAPQYKMPVKLLKFQNIVFRLMPSSSFRQTGFEKNDFIRLCSSMAEPDFSNLKISCPTLIVCGEKDRANKKAAIELSELITDSELSIIKDSGHEVNKDSPEKLAEILNSFYKRLTKNEYIRKKTE